MKKISVVCGCYNEEGNVEEVYRQVRSIFKVLPQYAYEHIFIDNASKDKTVEILKDIAKVDKNVKIIVNSRNFGHIRSPYYGILQAQGDAVIYLASDLQEPPVLIKDFIKKWETGYKIVAGVKSKSKENSLMFNVRRIFYKIISYLSESEQIENFTGFGLFDKKVIEVIRKIDDPYPYFRGLIAEVGYDIAIVNFEQPKRIHGFTKNNFYTLFDMALLGIINNSKVPLRLAIFLGSIFSSVCFILGIVYLIYKLLFWERFQLGIAPLVIGLFFFFSVQLFFIGILGEYIGAIYTQVRKRPLVIERERINFD
ncbi:MAG: glycosyltransferase family 2 protein [Candidatus Omnitrophota bacterium]